MSTDLPNWQLQIAVTAILDRFEIPILMRFYFRTSTNNLLLTIAKLMLQ